MTKKYSTIYTVPVLRKKHKIIGWTWQAYDGNKVVAVGKKICWDMAEAQKLGRRALKRRGLR